MAIYTVRPDISGELCNPFRSRRPIGAWILTKHK